MISVGHRGSVRHRGPLLRAVRKRLRICGRLPILLALLFTHASSALAAPPPTVDPRARNRSRLEFEKARQLADQGKWGDACPLFLDAHALNATNGTAFSLAECYDHVGDKQGALIYYQYVVDNADSERVPERLARSSRRIEEIKKELAPPPATASAVVSVAPPPPPPPSKVPVVIAFGAAGAGLAIGGVFGALALGDASKAKDGCVDLACPPENEAFASSARSKAWVSNIGLGVAVAGVAVGIVLLLTRHSSKTGAKEGAHAGLDGAIHF